jgi:hypothetical protein
VATLSQILGIILAILGIVYTIRSLWGQKRSADEQTLREVRESEERERKILEQIPMASERASQEYLAKHPKM